MCLLIARVHEQARTYLAIRGGARGKTAEHLNRLRTFLLIYAILSHIAILIIDSVSIGISESGQFPTYWFAVSVSFIFAALCMTIAICCIVVYVLLHRAARNFLSNHHRTFNKTGSALPQSALDVSSNHRIANDAVIPIVGTVDEIAEDGSPTSKTTAPIVAGRSIDSPSPEDDDTTSTVSGGLATTSGKPSKLRTTEDNPVRAALRSPLSPSSPINNEHSLDSALRFLLRLTVFGVILFTVSTLISLVGAVNRIRNDSYGDPPSKSHYSVQDSVLTYVQWLAYAAVLVYIFPRSKNRGATNRVSAIDSARPLGAQRGANSVI